MIDVFDLHHQYTAFSFIKTNNAVCRFPTVNRILQANIKPDPERNRVYRKET